MIVWKVLLGLVIFVTLAGSFYEITTKDWDSGGDLIVAILFSGIMVWLAILGLLSL